jgi:hypothetical protein
MGAAEPGYGVSEGAVQVGQQQSEQQQQQQQQFVLLYINLGTSDHNANSIPSVNNASCDALGAVHHQVG